MPTGVMRWKATAEDRLDQMNFMLEMARDSDILRVLHALDLLADETGSLRAAAVHEARLQGASWEDIGTALGITRQAAWERFRSVSAECAIPVGNRRNGAA